MTEPALTEDEQRCKRSIQELVDIFAVLQKSKPSVEQYTAFSVACTKLAFILDHAYTTPSKLRASLMKSCAWQHKDSVLRAAAMVESPGTRGRCEVLWGVVSDTLKLRR